MLARWQRKKRLDFGGNPVVDPTAGILERILPLQYIAVLAAAKGSAAVRMYAVSGPQIALGLIKGCLRGRLRSPSSSVLVCT